MNDNELERFENRKQKENMILIIVTCYSFGMMMVSLILGWPLYIPPVICAGLLGAWIMCFLKYRDFRFRANVLTLISLLDFTMYAVRAGSLYDILTPMAAVAVLLGITALPEVLRWVSIDTAFLFCFHTFYLKTVPFTTELDKCRAGLIIISIMLVEGVTYILIINQQSMLGQMQKIIDELKTAENSKSNFLSNVSHEIRTPINAVSGISEMILMEELPPKIKEDVYDIQMAGRNLQRIVNDILDFTELQSGNISLVNESYNITSTINDVMNMTVAQIENKNIELIVDCDSRIPRNMVGDEQKIRRVIMNIMNNAVKFTEEGCIRLAVTCRQEGYGVNLIISVEDTGIGIEGKNLEKLFMRFNQVDTRKNRQGNGIGLGLAISRALVQKMGGFIRVESEWKKGTKVQFVIPQKVLDTKPVIEVNDAREKRILSYINMEKYKYAFVRKCYEEMFEHITKQLQLPYLQSMNISELKYQLKKKEFSHILIGWKEYCEDKSFFEETSQKMPVVLVIDRNTAKENMEELERSNTIQMYKPFCALSVASVLNGHEVMSHIGINGNHVRFTAPEAAVLVVDDNLMNLKVVEGLLRPYQIRVFTAESGQKALEKINRRIYDFVFMDHMMPEMDGVETLHKIRQKSGNYFRTVPIIALTANAVGGAREMFLQEGFQDFVSKPIELPVLERVLRKYIPEFKQIKNMKQTPIVETKISPVKYKTDDTIAEMYKVNIKLGIKYSGGSMEDYKDIVKIYCSSGRKKIQEIQKYYEARDWRNYTILVHAVKSTSLGIGAEELSEQAKNLESAGKENQEEFIAEHHEQMMNSYLNVMNELETKILKESQKAKGQESQPEISKEKLLLMIKKLRENIESFEIESVKPLVEQLSGYQYNGKPLSEMTVHISEKVDAFDFIGAEEKLKDLEKEMG